MYSIYMLLLKFNIFVKNEAIFAEHVYMWFECGKIFL